jgi:TrmH family RNA methyltransferase
MPDFISSASNPIIKLARALRQKKARDESGLFLAEGILHVGEAAEAGWEIDTLIYCSERLKSEYGRQLVEKLIDDGIHSLQVSENAFESFAEKENPQGIAALVRQKNRKLDDLSDMKFMVALISPQDPGNVGSILRTIDAIDGDGLFLLDGGVDPFHPSVVRASMGTIFFKPFYQTSFSEFSEWAKVGRIRIIGTSAHANVDYRQLKLDSRPTVLLMGSEQKGLLADQMDVCSDMISLPMHGRATSLNLAVATGIFLYSLKG